jgi:sec-independent protein translocase protein TatC
VAETDLPFVGHLAELRRRIIVCLVAVLVCAGAAYAFIDRIVDLVLAPAGSLSYIYLAPPDLFTAYVKLAVFAGLLPASPLILFEIWLFVRPALSRKERSVAASVLGFGSLFFAAGCVFAYLVLVPMSISFLTQFSRPEIKPLFSFGEYVSFVGTLILGSGLTWEFPVLAAAGSRLGIIRPKALSAARKYSVLAIFIIAAIITPPDVVSQIILALPMWGLYEVGVLAARFFAPKEEKEPL